MKYLHKDSGHYIFLFLDNICVVLGDDNLDSRAICVRDARWQQPHC